jgi:hypothetical protein
MARLMWSEMGKRIAIMFCWSLSVMAVQAQQIPSLKLGENTVQFHAFASQGFAYTNENNFLTMDTSHGSFAMTDAAFNASMQVTSHFRVAAQAYVQNIGDLGGWQPHLDYAFGDYRLKDWFGIRAGRVKTMLGLYSDTQDADFLRTWALLPQAVYPTDLRSATIAHDGVDLYGDILLNKAGSLDYTLYLGTRPLDKLSGDYFQYEDAFKLLTTNPVVVSVPASSTGADLRWTTPVTGLMIGVSQAFTSSHFSAPAFGVSSVAGPDRTSAAYADYERGRFHFSGEYRSLDRFEDSRQNGVSLPGQSSSSGNIGWFVAGAYRLNKWLEIGTYHDRFYFEGKGYEVSNNPAADHVFDQAVTARFDVTKFCNLKVEGHFMNGYGNPLFSPHGFYLRSNPDGLKPDTNMLVVRIGFYL